MAIAKMVSRGYIRVIVTTNFDRLKERALEAQGISPTIIATPDAIQAALPLVYSSCTLIKLHGDYRDARLRNTVAELSTYDEETQSLIDKVLDEYCLIISGWFVPGTPRFEILFCAQQIGVSRWFGPTF